MIIILWHIAHHLCMYFSNVLFTIGHLLTPYQLVLTSVIQHSAVPATTQEGHAKHRDSVMAMCAQTD